MKKIDQFKQDFEILDNSLSQFAGDDVFKIDPQMYKTKKRKGKLVLMTAINPTKYGEGKTTCAIGLADGLNKIGTKTILALREPSMGPVFGSKGAATGGGECTIEPRERINLHFSGDMHAITSANNLISAAIDSHLYWGNKLGIDLETISWSRCLDVNDRALRNVKIKIKKDLERTEHFVITAASKMMTILSLASDLDDLRTRLSETIFAFDKNQKPLYLKQLDVVGSVLAILFDAVKPNLVFTKHGTPTMLHCGPFANIATGTNSAIETDLALKLSDVVVTESGFSSELGFQKYVDVVSYQHDFVPDCVVIVSTIRALKEKSDFENNFSSLQMHIDNVKRVTNKFLVVINKFSDDKDEDIITLQNYLTEQKVEFSINESFSQGPDGAIDFANKVNKILNNDFDFHPFIKNEIGIENKVNAIAKNYYYLPKVNFSENAVMKIKVIKGLDENIYNTWPIVFAKSPVTIDGNDKLDPNYEMVISDVELNTGARFILVLTNKVLMMPGLPDDGNFKAIDVIDDKIINIK
jgi:formate--tetrahydrofolate ligase